MPYNYYNGYDYNEASLNFKPMLKRLYDYSGKSALIVAHSFGNLITLKQLSLLDKDFKEKYV